jgi:hypothetical protein
MLKRQGIQNSVLLNAIKVAVGVLLLSLLLLVTIESNSQELKVRLQTTTTAEAAATTMSSSHLGASNCDSDQSPGTNVRRAVPKNLRLVFLGDSLTRYQYLSLCYFLRHGRWLDPAAVVNNLVNAHSFHHPLHPDDDWNEFFLQSNRMLYPAESCDCIRSRNGEILVERRYFYDDVRNNMVAYINMNGNQTNVGHGYYGRLDAETIYGPNFANLVGLPFGLNMNETSSRYSRATAIQWEFHDWSGVIRNHVGHLNLTYKRKDGRVPHVILNAGLHPHNFNDTDAANDVADALTEIGWRGIWKTTT